MDKIRAKTPATFLAICFVTALVSAAASPSETATGGHMSGQSLVEVTSDAVQTFYQSGVPHTDWSGNPRIDYEAGPSLFPIGIYYPEPCRSSHDFSWPRFTNTSHPWWSLFVAQGRNYDIAIYLDGIENEDDLRRAVYVVPEMGTGTQQRTLDKLPTGHNLYYEITPAPRFYLGDAVLASGTFTEACEAGDPDDSNVVGTLADADFNSLITGGFDPNGVPIQHPKIYTDLKNLAGVQDFEFIVNASFGSCGYGFPGQLFGPVSQGGQGYSENPDILGWQMEDEPLFHAARKNTACYSGGAQCNTTNMQAALDRVTNKYNAYTPGTDQLIFDVEATDYLETDPPAFPCNPYPYWEQFVRVGDVASHDNYLKWNEPGVPFQSTNLIATSMAHQTMSVNEAKPSWFTAQAFSYQDNGFPTPAQTRATVYTAIAHGATGIWYYVWDSYAIRGLGAGVRPTLPLAYPEQSMPGQISLATQAGGEQLWDSVYDLNHELKALEHVILWPTSRENYRVYVSHTGQYSPVRTMLKSTPGNQHYLIAVNMDNTPVDVEYRFDRTVISKSIEYDGIPGPAPALGGSGNVVSDTLAPFAAKVYRIRFSGFTDVDGDGVFDGNDNCAGLSNPNQTDADDDGAGTECDPNDHVADFDGDGCADGEELGGNQYLGGRRDPSNAWDFYDVGGPFGGPKDRYVDLPNDILGVAFKYQKAPPDPAYVESYDRGPSLGPHPWNMTAPDQYIDLPNDILGVAFQYQHNCQAAP